jgi:hypothetical protein
VLNEVPDAESEAYLRAALARHAIIPVTAIHEDRALAGAWMRGDPLEADARAKDAAAIVDALEAAEAVAA